MMAHVFWLTCLASLFGTGFFQEGQCIQTWSISLPGHDHAFSTHTGSHSHDHVIPRGTAASHLHIDHGSHGNHADSHRGSFAIRPPSRHQNTVVDPHIDTHSHSWDSHIGQQTSHGTHSEGVHVDLPGQHGNDSPFPVVHRPHATHSHHEHNIQETHVVLPGEHGNNSPYPIIQRPSKPTAKSTTNTHVDLPGEHGNNSPFPVIHRPHESHSVHVHLPGQDGNDSPYPVIHRPNAGNPHVDIKSKADTASHPVSHGPHDHLGEKVQVHKPDHHGVNTSHTEIYDPHALETHSSHLDIHAPSAHESHVPLVPRRGPPGSYYMSPITSTGLHHLREPPYGPPFRGDFMPPPVGLQPGGFGAVPLMPPPPVGLAPPGISRFGPGPPLHGGLGFRRFPGRFGPGRRRRRLERIARRTLVSTLVTAITNMLRG